MLPLPGAWTSGDVDEVVDVAVLIVEQGCLGQIGASVGAEVDEPGSLTELARARIYEARRRRKALRVGQGS